LAPRKTTAEAPKRPANCKCRVYLGKSEHEEGCPAGVKSRAKFPRGNHVPVAAAKPTAKPAAKFIAGPSTVGGATIPVADKSPESSLSPLTNAALIRLLENLGTVDLQSIALTKIREAIAKQTDVVIRYKQAVEDTSEFGELTEQKEKLKALKLSLEQTQGQFEFSVSGQLLPTWRKDKDQLSFADHSPKFNEPPAVKVELCAKCKENPATIKSLRSDGRLCASCFQEAPATKPPNLFNEQAKAEPIVVQEPIDDAAKVSKTIEALAESLKKDRQTAQLFQVFRLRDSEFGLAERLQQLATIGSETGHRILPNPPYVQKIASAASAT
jgi:hypothetical protein